jgi:hypothetical protein
VSSNDVGNFPNGRFTFNLRSVGLPAENSGDTGGESELEGAGESEQTGEDVGGEQGDEDDLGTDEFGGASEEQLDEGGSLENESDLPENEVASVLPGPACGMGLPLASLMGLVSLGGMRTVGRANRRA